MKPDWDKLMDLPEFKGSSTSLIADVDCTADGKSLCEKHDVRGYPTIKHGDPSDLKDYNGGRSFDDFKKFAEENLGPTCGVEHLDLCDEDTKSLIEKFQKMTADELNAALADADAKIGKVENAAMKAVEKTEAKIKELSASVEKEKKKKDDAVAKENKKTGLRMMKAVAADKKKNEVASGKKKKKRKGSKEL